MCLSPIQKIFASFTAERDYKHDTTRRSAAAARHQSKTQLQAGVWGEQKNKHEIADFFSPSGENTESNRVSPSPQIRACLRIQNRSVGAARSLEMHVQQEVSLRVHAGRPSS